MTTRKWKARLSDIAKADLDSILDWTTGTYGDLQAQRYLAAIESALRKLENGPLVLGSVSLDDVRPGMRSLHINRAGHRGRHLIVYEARNGGVIWILRILHDAMDIRRHIPPSGMAEEPAEMLP